MFPLHVVYLRRFLCPWAVLRSLFPLSSASGAFISASSSSFSLLVSQNLSCAFAHLRTRLFIFLDFLFSVYFSTMCSFLCCFVRCQTCSFLFSLCSFFSLLLSWFLSLGQQVDRFLAAFLVSFFRTAGRPSVHIHMVLPLPNFSFTYQDCCYSSFISYLRFLFSEISLCRLFGFLFSPDVYVSLSPSYCSLQLYLLLSFFRFLLQVSSHASAPIHVRSIFLLSSVVTLARLYRPV